MIDWQRIALSLLEDIDIEQFDERMSLNQCAELLQSQEDAEAIMPYIIERQQLHWEQARKSREEVKQWYDNLPLGVRLTNR